MYCKSGGGRGCTSQLWSDTVGELGQYSHPCRTSTPILFDPLPPILIWDPVEISAQCSIAASCYLT